MLASAAACGVPIYTSSPGDSSIGMNVAYHELMNDSRLMIDPNKDVNEICAFILAGQKNVSFPVADRQRTSICRVSRRCGRWDPKGGNDFFIQITTDQVVWGGCPARHQPRPSAGAR